MPDVRAAILEHKLGRVVEPNTAEHWRSCLQDVISNLDRFGSNVRDARRPLSWDNIEDDFISFLGDVKSVTFISFRNLQNYERHKRLAKSLLKRGVKVRFFYTAPAPPEPGSRDGVDHFVISSLYSAPVTAPVGPVGPSLHT